MILIATFIGLYFFTGLAIAMLVEMYTPLFGDDTDTTIFIVVWPISLIALPLVGLVRLLLYAKDRTERRYRAYKNRHPLAHWSDA